MGGFLAIAASVPIAISGIAGIAWVVSGAPSPQPASVPPGQVQTQPLRLVPSPVLLAPDEQLFGMGGLANDRRAMLAAVDHSLRYLKTPKAAQDYKQYAASGITRDRVQRSLIRFRQLLTKTRSATELSAAIQREFVLYQAAGKDHQGAVAFTGYFEPVHAASRVPTSVFRYPIFRLPRNFSQWSTPHPTRVQLEGRDGLQYANSQLKGLELVWLRDRLEAYLIQVQGSARLQLIQGGTMTVGYAGATNYPYTSIGRELVEAGKIKQDELTLPVLIDYFRQNPVDLDLYLPRNQRFVFFKETQGSAATGSIGVPVTPERSIATDKSLFPAGALALIQTQIPYRQPDGQFKQRQASRFVLDQDTGSAIKGPGRVDIFMGTGQLAGDRAGLINSTGQLYYLLLKK